MQKLLNGFGLASIAALLECLRRLFADIGQVWPNGAFGCGHTWNNVAADTARFGKCFQGQDVYKRQGVKSIK